MQLIVLFVSLLATLVVAQPSVGELPSCAIGCVTGGIEATGCQLTNVTPIEKPLTGYVLNFFMLISIGDVFLYRNCLSPNYCTLCLSKLLRGRPKSHSNHR